MDTSVKWGSDQLTLFPTSATTRGQFRIDESERRVWWAKWERDHALPDPTLRNVCHCGTEIRSCHCVAHPPPMWIHWPSGFHRCGDYGNGPRAEPWATHTVAARKEEAA